MYIHHDGGLGGAPKSLSYLIESIDKTKYKPMVAVLRNGPVVKLFQDAGAEVIVLPKFATPFHGTTVAGIRLQVFIRNYLLFIPTFIIAYQLISKTKPAILHLNTTCLFMFALAAKVYSKKIFVITHVREPLLNTLSGKILKYMNYWFTDYDIPICRYDQTRMKKRKNSTVIYNAVNMSNTMIPPNNILKKEFGLGEDTTGY